MIKEWICMGRSLLKKDDFNSVKNLSYFVKPTGGLWISPYTPNDTYISAWLKWCSENDFRDYNKSVILTIKDNAKIYVINSQFDLIELIKKYEKIQEPMGDHLFTIWKIIDFEEVSKHYDMIYLTERGQNATHMPFKNSQYSLYGWDCESAIVLNFDIINSQRIGGSKNAKKNDS